MSEGEQRFEVVAAVLRLLYPERYRSSGAARRDAIAIIAALDAADGELRA